MRKWLKEYELYSIFKPKDIFYPYLVAEFYSRVISSFKDIEDFDEFMYKGDLLL